MTSNFLSSLLTQRDINTLTRYLLFLYKTHNSESSTDIKVRVFLSKFKIDDHTTPTSLFQHLQNVSQVALFNELCQKLDARCSESIQKAQNDPSLLPAVTADLSKSKKRSLSPISRFEPVRKISPVSASAANKSSSSSLSVDLSNRLDNHRWGGYVAVDHLTKDFMKGNWCVSLDTSQHSINKLVFNQMDSTPKSSLILSFNDIHFYVHPQYFSDQKNQRLIQLMVKEQITRLSSIKNRHEQVQNYINKFSSIRIEQPIVRASLAESEIDKSLSTNSFNSSDVPYSTNPVEPISPVKKHQNVFILETEKPVEKIKQAIIKDEQIADEEEQEEEQEQEDENEDEEQEDENEDEEQEEQEDENEQEEQEEQEQEDENEQDEQDSGEHETQQIESQDDSDNDDDSSDEENNIDQVSNNQVVQQQDPSVRVKRKYTKRINPNKPPKSVDTRVKRKYTKRNQQHTIPTIISPTAQPTVPPTAQPTVNTTAATTVDNTEIKTTEQSPDRVKRKYTKRAKPSENEEQPIVQQTQSTLEHENTEDPVRIKRKYTKRSKSPDVFGPDVITNFDDIEEDPSVYKLNFSLTKQKPSLPVVPQTSENQPEEVRIKRKYIKRSKSPETLENQPVIDNDNDEHVLNLDDDVLPTSPSSFTVKIKNNKNGF